MFGQWDNGGCASIVAALTFAGLVIAMAVIAISAVVG